MGKESSSSNSSNPVQVFQWLNRMVSEPYYLFHFLTFFSYLIVRSSATQVLAPHVTHHLLRREIQTLLVFALLALVKGVKEETWEAFIADALFLAKICPFLLAITMDRLLAIWYILVFLGSMGQLPTFILFENAAEVARFPELDFEATYFHPTITKGLLSRHFELDRYLLEYINGK
uniref:Uncharacterized protein n=1 Tax=Cajanus cajan TaxID=3821 RepID=A0A151S047_CAJCA|nr:hypothetical protein KK1_030172 [Cajanus cajan]